MFKAAKPLSIQIGYQAEETPRCFFIVGCKIEVIDIVDRWLDPEHHYFKVYSDEGDAYTLKYDAASDERELILYNSSSSHDTSHLVKI